MCVCVSQSEFWFLLFVNATHLIGSSGFLKAFDRNIKYGGHLESKERFAIQRYLLIIGKKQNMQVLSHTFTYFST